MVMELVLFSKHLLFLSFHTVHLMHTGAILHHFFCVFFVLMLFQHHSRSFVILGIIHWVSAKARNNCHRIHQLSCNVGRDGYYSLPFLGIKNILEPKKKNILELSWIPLFCNTSWVKQAFLTTSQVKHVTLKEALVFLISFHGQSEKQDVCRASKVFSILATLPISQSFNGLLRERFPSLRSPCLLYCILSCSWGKITAESFFDSFLCHSLSMQYLERGHVFKLLCSHLYFLNIQHTVNTMCSLSNLSTAFSSSNQNETD